MSGDRVRSNLNAMRALSLPSLMLRLALIGAASGPIAWLLILAVAGFFGMEKPNGMALLFAIPRGALYGIIIAVILHLYWKRHRA